MFFSWADFFSKLGYWVGFILYFIGRGLCQLIDFMYSMFQKFAGVVPIVYKNGKVYLINVFFGNSEITTVYWGMATIGTVLTFFFAIIAVTKKSFDIDDKMKQTHGGIIRASVKSILIIVSMNFILVATISGTNVLLQQITYVFNNPGALSQVTEMEYTEEQYAIMARVCNNIGNHALTPSRANRYNINTCYNEIREDMLTLQKQNVFVMDYEASKQQNGDNWQYVLAKIANSADLTKDVSVNVFYPALDSAMTEAFTIIDNTKNFYPLRTYKVPKKPVITNEDTPFGAMLFLSASFDAALNGINGSEASLTDSVRGKYLEGKRNYCDVDQVEEDFDLNVTSFNHLTLIISCIFVGLQFVAILIDCVVRIFNMLLLYLTAPFFASTMPLDEGSKFKQWTLSFTIQTLSIIGTVITLRLYMLFVPIIMSSDLQILDGSFANMIAKVIFLVGGAMAAKGANRLITGILAEQAGMSAIHASNVGGAVASKLGSVAAGLGGVAYDAAGELFTGMGLFDGDGKGKGDKKKGKDGKKSEGGKSEGNSVKDAATNAAKDTVKSAASGDAGGGGDAGGKSGGEGGKAGGEGGGAGDAAQKAGGDAVKSAVGADGGADGGEGGDSEDGKGKDEGPGAARRMFGRLGDLGLQAMKETANAASAVATMAATGEASDGFIDGMVASHDQRERKRKEEREEAKKKRAPSPQSNKAKQTQKGKKSDQSSGGSDIKPKA